MMKKLLPLLLMVFCATQIWAQRTVSGTVTSAEDNEPLIGVSVLVIGTTTGTITDIEGNYSIEVPENATLAFSYTGYQEQQIVVGNQTKIDVVLAAGVALDEVVVTALGISRDKKALGYSVTEVGGENFTEAREINIANALSGRIAGVNVSRVASGPGGSSRVVIRGNKSLQGNNQPLYVVDGIPMDNSGFGQAGLWGGRDEGDGMSSINPDDIESITVLKGANAAALYGSRAANGVINIITKKGSSRKGVGIEFTSNYVFETVNNLSDLQQEFGSGAMDGNVLATRVATAPRTLREAYQWGDDSWGPRLDGRPVLQFDGVTRPYSYAGDNWARFYQTGSSLTNTLAFTGGNEKQNFRVAISNLLNESIIPNSGYDRTNVSISTNSKFGERITFVAKALYSNEYAKNRQRLSDSPGNSVQALWRMPPNYNVENYKGDPGKLGAIPEGTDPALLEVWQKQVGEEYQQAENNWGQNPYWVSYQFIDDDWRDRLITSGQLRYDFTDWLYAQGRVGMDWFTRRDRGLTPQGTGYQRGGSMNEGEDRVREINMEWILGFDKSFGKLNVNAFAGGNRMRRSNERISANGNNFNVPFFAAINNAALRNFSYGFSESGINSLFGSLELGYGGFLYLTGTARNDWFSVLNPDYNSILYPSLGGSFVFTDAFSGMPSWLSFGKVRASWAQVGNVTVSPYQTILTYSLKGDHTGIPLASFSSAGGNNGSIPNPAIQPLTSTELEFGVDLRFFRNRLGLDLTYYRQKTTDDILNATISRASGFGSTIVNLGEMQNNGIEILLTGTPVTGAFNWDVSFNFAKNENKVVSLIEGATELTVEEPRTRNVFVKHIVGYPFGMLTGRVQRLSPDGQPVFHPDGYPLGSSGLEIIGNGVADWTGGLNNSFSYKNFNLSFLIDIKVGGDIFSGTNMRLTQWGLHKQSLQGREGEAPLTVTGVVQNGTTFEPFTKTLTPGEAQNYWNQVGSETNGVTTMFLYDASFAKLRQLTFGYNFPKSILSKSPFQTLNLSFVGRNLAILFKNTENIDPESAYANGNGQGLDYFGMPSVRSFGFNLKAGF